MPDDILSAALRYAQRGWHVFPCKPRAKTPLTKHGLKDATTDIDTIRAWWANLPQANVAIACGASGLVVIDVDVKNGSLGIESWKDLLEEHGRELGETATAETPSGGLHLFYRANGRQVRNSAGRLAPGIDVRADGGYVIAAPSVHPNGGMYSWAMGYDPDEMDLLPFPDALREAEASTKTAQPVGDIIPQGQRNNALMSLAGSMRRRGMSETAILAALEAENAERCQPPLPEAEVIKIAHSASQYSAETQIALADLHKTDLGNAEMLAALYGNRLRYDWRRGRWLVWQKHRWTLDDDGVTQRIANLVARNRMKLAANIDDKEKRAAAYRWAYQSEGRQRIAAMLWSAQSLKPMATSGAEFDTDPWLLGVANGVLNLKTGILRDGQPTDNITLSTPIPFLPDAKCPRFLQFLQEIFDKDQDLIAYIRSAVGYCLTADCREECLFLCWGAGCNGKTVLLNTLRAVLGDYAANTPFSTFEASRYHGIPNDLAALMNKRLVTASETAEARRLNEARIKSITGRDPLTCRFMRGEWFTYTPTFRVWLAMNNKPTIRGTDRGIWRRIRLIPFTVNFEDRADLTLEKRLRSELPGILAWAMRGCLEWQQIGLQEPNAVLKATESYRLESDVLGRFLEDCAILKTGLQVRTGRLYQVYVNWCKENGEKPLTGRWLSSKLSEHGVGRGRDYQGRFYRNIGLPTEPSMTL